MTTDGQPDGQPADSDNMPDASAATDPASVAEDRAGRRWPVRRVLAWVVTGLAGLLVLSALVAPNRLSGLSLAALVRIPVEGLVGVALLVVVPARVRRVLAVLLGAALGVLTVLKILDMGFYSVLQRPFDPVLDWVLIGDAESFLTDSIGRAGAVGAAVAAVLLVLAVLVLSTLSVMRLTRLMSPHRTTAARGVAVLAVVWVLCAALGVQIVPGLPVASTTEATLAYDHARAVGVSRHDQSTFAAQAGVDAFRDTPGDQLLTALRGKDVIFCFVESYGRTAVQNPQVDAMLDANTRALDAAGFASRSGYLTSPTTTGASWLAHSTLLSGLWINNQERYENLVTSDRLTLTSAFRRAGWRTVGVEPGVTRAWPEGRFYGYDQVYDNRNLGYVGPKFGWATMPDQYALQFFQNAEYSKPGRGPLLAEITLVSSHAPWAPIPHFIGWDQVGDGSVYNGIEAHAAQASAVWPNTARVRAAYMQSIEYSINTLVSYVQTYANNNLVLVFLGDHQPASIIVGENASRDVPIAIVAHDPAVLDRVSGWGWDTGLRPSAQAPVWTMDAFRNRFLTAFGPQSN